MVLFIHDIYNVW